MERYVVVVAGGKGLRMGVDVPKQFLMLAEKPILMHTLEAFSRFDESIRFILVLPEDQVAYWNELCEHYQFAVQHQVVIGGETRFHSVKKGLEQVPDKVLVGIHDGVRPILSRNMLADCFGKAEIYGGAYPVIPVVDTLRRLTEAGAVWVDRSEYVTVQTPQVFHSDILKKAYEQDYSASFTDDVSVVEEMGGCRIETVSGNKLNLKITTPEDLLSAEAFLKFKDL